MDVIGYADRFSARPGERLTFMVSCELPAFRVEIVKFDRSILSDPSGARPETIVSCPATGTHPGRHQAIHAGSYLIVDDLATQPFADGLTFQCWIWPTLPAHGREEGIASTWSSAANRGFALLLDDMGRPTFRAGDGTRVIETKLDRPVVARRWYAVAAAIDKGGEVRLRVRELDRGWLAGWETMASTPGAGNAWSGEPLLMAALTRQPVTDGAGTRLAPTGLYNGKIDRPRLWLRGLSDGEIDDLFEGAGADTIPGLHNQWIATAEIRSRRVPDDTGGAPAQVVNLPSRGVTGANWTGNDVSYLAIPGEYGAIHFHEDDLEDAGWQPDFGFDVPADLPSGMYAARLTAGSTVDAVPFFVRSRPGHESKVLYLSPTNTYLAYGNEKLFRAENLDMRFVERSTNLDIQLTNRDRYLEAHPELGASTYDKHADRSGTMYSSRLRPVLTMRPDFINWMTREPRHFSGDLFLIEWLEHTGIPYDVATDEDLHVEGRAALDPYKVVVTGSHPEYWTTPMMDAIEGYLHDGGRFMYLGGNGFYWVTGMDSDYPHVIEIRRGRAGTRAWESDPGEEYFTTAPEPGGLWRYRGRTPNKLTGIGFASQGWGGAEAFERLPASDDPRAAFIFEGIDRAGLIGDFGLVMEGAAGDELDRYDLDLGTPPETLRLATSQGRHSDYYQLVVEDTPLMMSGLGGRMEPKVRADITLLEGQNGAAVFSTGSIAWSGALPVNGFDNNVARITANVLRKFMAD